MDVSEINQLIEKKEYEKALSKIKEEIDSLIFGIHNDDEYIKYKELLRLRIIANSYLGKNDEIIHTIARRDRYPYESKVDFGNDNFVRLYDKDIFFIKTSAYVNAIHKDKLFNFDKKSFSHSLWEKLGEAEISKQILEMGKINENKPFVKLLHPNLSAPQSYHLPALTNNNEMDLQLLKNYLKELLIHFNKVKLDSFTFVAMGSSGRNTRDEQELIIEIIADELNNFFENKSSQYNPVINFSFVNYKSLSRYEKILNQKTNLGKFYADLNKELNERQKKIISIAKTKNEYYKKQLVPLSFHIDKKDSMILLLGESGVGKSYIAREIIHNCSNRKDKPFEQVNCAGYPPKLLYSKLFGSVKGSYTGSIEDKKGIFEIADEGTVFLDEIGSVDELTQQTLMTFLDKGEYKKLGGEEVYRSNCKLVFGTDQDLEQMVHKGSFRKQFYERISNDRKIIIPPIRERKEDSDTIIDAALSEFNQNSPRNNLDIGITDEARSLIKKHLWPGNYRQLYFSLKNWHEDAIYLGKIKIDKEVINANPPRASSFNDNKLGLLENLLKEYMKEWDKDNKGKFRDEFVNPILAKIFLEDLQLSKSHSNEYLGFDGTHSGKGIDLLYKKYNTNIRNQVE